MSYVPKMFWLSDDRIWQCEVAASAKICQWAPFTKSKKKSRGFLLCFFPACTLPQVLCQNQNYCSGVCVVSHVEIAAEAL